MTTNPIEEFASLSEKGVITISKIEWWLLKYSDQFKSIKKAESNKHLCKLNADSIVSLPPFWEKTENQTFLNLYNALEELSSFHKFENYFKKQISDFRNLKSSKDGLKEWLLQNEKLGAEKFVCFLIDYLDYDEDDNVKHLKVFVPSVEKLNIYVNITDFKYTVEFLENFNKLYWTD